MVGSTRVEQRAETWLPTAEAPERERNGKKKEGKSPVAKDKNQGQESLKILAF